MNRGFLYYFTGGKNAVQLLVSIWSLRKSGHGDPVLICCGDDEAYEYAGYMCNESRMLPEVRRKRITVEVAAFKQRGKGNQHCRKSAMGRWTEFDKTIFLDADTAVVGSLADLWPLTEQVVLTQFASWKTTGGMMRNRLRRYREQLPKEVAMMTGEHAYPAINTGVMAWDAGATGFHKQWQDVCLKTAFNGTMPFMGDEITANLIMVNYPHTILDDRWNFSPMFSIKDRDGVIPTDIKCWHFHGQKHLRPNGAREVWLPLYKECVAANLAEIQAWTPARDASLKKFLQENPS